MQIRIFIDEDFRLQASDHSLNTALVNSNTVCCLDKNDINIIKYEKKNRESEDFGGPFRRAFSRGPFEMHSLNLRGIFLWISGELRDDDV